MYGDYCFACCQKRSPAGASEGALEEEVSIAALRRHFFRFISRRSPRPKHNPVGLYVLAAGYLVAAATLMGTNLMALAKYGLDTTDIVVTVGFSLLPAAWLVFVGFGVWRGLAWARMFTNFVAATFIVIGLRGGHVAWSIPFAIAALVYVNLPNVRIYFD